MPSSVKQQKSEIDRKTGLPLNPFASGSQSSSFNPESQSSATPNASFAAEANKMAAKSLTGYKIPRIEEKPNAQV